MDKMTTVALGLVIFVGFPLLAITFIKMAITDWIYWIFASSFIFGTIYSYYVFIKIFVFPRVTSDKNKEDGE